MDIQDIQEGPTLKSHSEDAGPSSRSPAELIRIEEKPKTELDIWDRVRHGHVATAMRLRSLLLFIASTIMTYLESITVQHRKNPPEMIACIVTKFINGSQEFHRDSTNETFLDTLFAKLPTRDSKGMLYHEVYLSVSSMISSVNWTRMKFDRTDAMRCYNSLANVLHVCFDQVGVMNRSEADQLVLAIYVASVWCSIIKKNPELASPRGIAGESEDFETHMKTWIFHPSFENFSTIFVSSCLQILEISDSGGDRLEKVLVETTSPRGPPELEGVGEREVQQPVSLTAAPLVHVDPVSQCTTPTNPLSIHPSWHVPPYPAYIPDGQMFPFSAGMYPHQHIYTPVLSYQPEHQQQTPPARRGRGSKRKTADQPMQLPNFQQLTDSISKPRIKKGPKPGTRYRERITEEATMILRIEAAIMAQSASKMSKKEISRRTNISLHQVKSFFNRITAERKREEMGKPIRHRSKRRKFQMFFANMNICA